jgi:hypothetical protein
MEKNYRIISDPSIINIHLGVPRTLLQVLEKQIWHGRGMVRVLRKREFNDKVYLATNIFLILHLWLFMFLISPLPLRVRVPGLLFLLLAIVCILVLASLNNALRSGTFRYLPHLIPIFYPYFIGRSIALMKIYFDLFGTRVKTLSKTKESE